MSDTTSNITPDKVVVRQSVSQSMTPDPRISYDPRVRNSEGLDLESEHFSLYPLFNLTDAEKADDGVHDKMRTLYQWAKQKLDSADTISILRTLLSLENRIGTPRLGVSRLNHLYQYVKLDNQINALSMARDRMSF